MAEAILTGEQVEKFALENSAAIGALVETPFARLAKYFLVRHGPGDAGDWYCDHEKRDELCRKIYDAEPPPCEPCEAFFCCAFF